MIGSRGAAAARHQPPERFAGFRPAALSFFRQLKRRNTRPWFEAHRAVYEAEVKRPLRALVEEVDVALARFAPEIVGDPRRSMFRIHRDVRFSRDKSPYKTHAACWFYHVDAGRGVGGEAAGRRRLLFSAGTGGLSARRRDLDAAAPIAQPDSARRWPRTPERFEAIVLAPAFRRRFGALDEDAMLKRLPRGYAEITPAARWLRHQSFTAGRALTEAEALSPRLARSLARDFAALTPFVRWLNGALGFQQPRAPAVGMLLPSRTPHPEAPELSEGNDGSGLRSPSLNTGTEPGAADPSPAPRVSG